MNFLNRKATVIAIVLIFLIVLPLFVGNEILHVFILIFYYGFLGLSWNIIGGYTGQFSFGHAAFYGIGAYTSSFLFIEYGVSPWLGMFIGGALAALYGLFIGVVSFRYGVRGAYFLMLTLAFAELLRVFATNLQFVGGAQGLVIPLKGNAPLLFQFTSKVPYYYVGLCMLAGGTLLSFALVRSKYGKFLLAIRENEDTAQSIGIHTTRYKIFALGLSSFLTAMGGTFYAQYLMYIAPDFCFGLMVNIEIVLRPMIGGVGTVLGPVFGSFILGPISEIIRVLLGGSRPGLSLMIYAVMVMLICKFMPKGIWPWVSGRIDRWISEIEGEKGAKG
jgi:branched-chain amino acid transport system permease protein